MRRTCSTVPPPRANRPLACTQRLDWHHHLTQGAPWVVHSDDVLMLLDGNGTTVLPAPPVFLHLSAGALPSS